MTVVTLLLGLALIGLIVYLIDRFIPMAEPFKILIRVVAVIVVILWLLQAFAISLPSLPRLR